MKEFIKNFFNEMMTEPDVNSRFVFLLHGVATAMSILALTVGFFFVHDRSGFPTMVAAVTGGGFGAALGRYFTKKGGADADTVAGDTTA